MRTVLLSLLVGCAPIPRPVAPPGELRSDREQRETAVQLEVYCHEHGEWKIKTGSGVIVSAYQAMTDYHVVRCDEDNPIIYVYNVDGRSWKAFIEASWKDRDVVRLSTYGGNFWPTPRPPLIRVTQLSYGESLFLQVAVPAHGEILGMAIGRGYENSFYYDAHTEPGNSGGGIWDQEGRLVGFHGGRVTYDNVDYAWGTEITPEMVPH